MLSREALIFSAAVTLTVILMAVGIGLVLSQDDATRPEAPAVVRPELAPGFYLYSADQERVVWRVDCPHQYGVYVKLLNAWSGKDAHGMMRDAPGLEGQLFDWAGLLVYGGHAYYELRVGPWIVPPACGPAYGGQ